MANTTVPTAIRKFMRNIEWHPTLSISQLPKDEPERAQHGARGCPNADRATTPFTPEAGTENCKTVRHEQCCADALHSAPDQ
jgi:hypothetical protein